MNKYEAMNALYMQFLKGKITRQEYEKRIAVLEAVDTALMEICQ